MINKNIIQKFKNNNYISNNLTFFELISINTKINTKINNKNNNELNKIINFFRALAYVPYKKGELNGMKLKNCFMSQISDKELMIIYNNINEIDNFYLKGKFCDYFWSNKFLKKERVFEAFEKALFFYLKELKFLLNKNIIDISLFDETFDRYITLSTKIGLSSNKKVNKKYLQCFRIIKLILNKCVKKELYIYIGLIYRNFSHKENEHFLNCFILNERINTNKNQLKIYIKSINFYLRKQLESKNFDLIEFCLLDLKNILNNSKRLFTNDHKKLTSFINYLFFHNEIKKAESRMRNLEKEGFLREAIIFGIQNKINKNILNQRSIELYELKENLEFDEISCEQTIEKEEIFNLLDDYVSLELSGKIDKLTYNFYFELRNEDKFNEEVEKSLSKNIIQYLVYNIAYDENYNVKHINKIKIMEEMTNIEITFSTFNLFLIQPILDNIKQTNFIYPQFFRTLLTDNYFIPKEHEIFFEKGLYYFFNGNIIESMHLLIPQIESSLKYILRYKESIIIQNLDGTEKNDIKIDGFLELCKKHKLIDDKIIFYLDKLFNKDYFNIRNNLAHGFNKDRDFLSPLYNGFVCILLYILIYENQKYLKNLI